MLRFKLVLLVLVLGFLLIAQIANAHFQMIIPNKILVSNTAQNEVKLSLMFAHPFDRTMMNMDRPTVFGVLSRGKHEDLLPILKPIKINGFTAFEANYKLKRPGDYLFYLEPAPYFEPAENRFLVHYTKVIVNAFNMEGGWDHEVGLKAEIIPTVRPYGLWTGNLFQGIIKLDGKPVPFAEIEIEYYNQSGEIKSQNKAFSTQVIKSDKNGFFSYSMVKAGWWGFAALLNGEKKIEHDGKLYPVEVGAVMWIKIEDME